MPCLSKIIFEEEWIHYNNCRWETFTLRKLKHICTTTRYSFMFFVVIWHFASRLDLQKLKTHAGGNFIIFFEQHTIPLSISKFKMNVILSGSHIITYLLYSAVFCGKTLHPHVTRGLERTLKEAAASSRLVSSEDNWEYKDQPCHAFQLLDNWMS